MQLLQPSLVWLHGLGIVSLRERLLVRFPVRAHTWIAVLVPGHDAYERQPINVSLSKESDGRKMKIDQRECWCGSVIKCAHVVESSLNTGDLNIGIDGMQGGLCLKGGVG